MIRMDSRDVGEFHPQLIISDFEKVFDFDSRNPSDTSILNIKSIRTSCTTLKYIEILLIYIISQYNTYDICMSVSNISNP